MGTRQHPAHPDGRGSIQRLAVALLFLLYIEPLLRWIHVGGRGYRFGCLPTKDRTDTNQVRSRMLTTSTATTTVSDLRVQAQNSTPLQANSVCP
jgi:hypothetical protein